MVFFADSPISDSLTSATTDGTYQSGQLHFPNGLTYTINSLGQVTKIEDRNGNLTTLVYTNNGASQTIAITDPTGRSITVSISENTAPGGSSDTITYPGFNNFSRQIVITHTPLNNALATGQSLATYAALFPALNGRSSNFVPNVFSSVQFPDGMYAMKYNSYGELAQLILPTGGAYNYTYGAGAGDPSGVIPISQYAGYSIYRRLIERDELSDGTNISGKTVFSAGVDPTGDPNHPGRPVTKVQINREDQSGTTIRQETHYFFGDPSSANSIPAPTNYPDWTEGLEGHIEIGDGSTIPLVVDRIYQQRPCGPLENCWYSPQSDTAPAHDPQLCQTNQSLDGLSMGQVFSFDPNNNVTAKWEFDYGNAPAVGATCPTSPTGYMRLTQNTYLTAGPYLTDAVHLVNLLSSTTVGPSPGTTVNIAYDETAPSPETGIVQLDASPVYRGNATTISTYSNTLGQTLSTTLTYDVAGNPLTVKDPIGNKATWNYHYSNFDPNNTFAYPNQVINALTQSTLFNYDWASGLLSSIATPDGVTQSFQYDNMGRINLSYFGSSGSPLDNTQYSYPSMTQGVRYESLDASTTLHTNSFLDGLGRPNRIDNYENANQFIEEAVTYDALGRVSTVTNPNRPGDGLGLNTVYSYDALGRIINVAYPDGSNAGVSYVQNQLTLTDPAGKKRAMTVDALGRLTGVTEDPGGANFSTTYTYDALNDLTGVTQGSQTRSFVFDGVGFLTSTTQPESGTVTYVPDKNGNVHTQTDARGTVTTYAFDALNRVQAVSYSDGTPAVTYTYDTNPSVTPTAGHLISVSNTSSVTNYQAFDAQGRVSASQQITAGQTYNFAYTYNYAGALISETYPSGRTVYTCNDGANRPLAMGLNAGCAARNYIDTISYAPHGSPSYYHYGNNLWRTLTYNARLQWSAVNDVLDNNPSESLFSQQFTWTSSPSSLDNNGTLRAIALANGGGPGTTPIQFNQTFGYDSLNRLNSFSDSGPVAQTYAYDQYGSMWVTSGTNNPLTPFTSTWIDSSTNRLAPSGSFAYDNSGNLTLFGGTAMTYDAENRMNLESQTGFEAVLYRYDGAGQRVEACQTNTPGVCDPAGTQNVFVYDVFGNLAAEYDSGSPVTPICTTCYISPDQVGSPRLVTGAGGAMVSRHDYLPFGYDVGTNYGRNNTGQQNSGWGQTDYVKELFTGQLQDTETQFDWFRTRYYTYLQGRFHSPDPLNAGVDLTNPQSWNGYAYVNNNPLSNNDPSGLQGCAAPCISYNNPGQNLGSTSGGASSLAGGGFGWSWGGGVPAATTISAPNLPAGGPLDVFIGGAKQAVSDILSPVLQNNPTPSATSLRWFLRPSTQLQQNGAAAVGLAVALMPLGDAAEFAEGSFSVIDWSGYPEGLPRPSGPFRLLRGAEYKEARSAADAANDAMRGRLNLRGQPVQVHEIHPVKFGGDPIAPANKVLIPTGLHQQVTSWWNRFMWYLSGQ